MKFHWFAEVTYDDLPADFPQKHHSAWVDTPTQLVDSTRIGEIYRMFIRLMTQADGVGFDGLAVNEHHQTAFAMTPSPNLLAASLASNTENAAILVIGAAGTAFAGGDYGVQSVHVPTLDRLVADGSKVVVIKQKSGS